MSGEPYRSYTPAERRQRATQLLRGAKRAVADCDTSRFEKAIDRIDARAEERGARELAAMKAQLEAAKQAVALAKTALRTAARTDRAAAKKALHTAEDTLRRIERAARRLGL